MRIPLFILAGILAFNVPVLAQKPASTDSQKNDPLKNDAPPSSDQSDDDVNSSSSRDTRIDITPPKNDTKDHPTSGLSDEMNADTSGDVNEAHPFNPYRALRDDDVGDYYFKLGNYKAALARYQDALDWKENDAEANFKMGQCYEKLNDPVQAAAHYRAYLKTLPNGPHAKEAHKALEKLPTSPDTAQK